MSEIHYGRKRSGIKRELTKKIDEWLATIDDEEVRELASKHTIVTGGCIASMLLGEQVKDFDVYFRNKHVAVRVAEYYVAKFNRANMKQDKDEDDTSVSYTPTVKTDIINNIKGIPEERVIIFMKSAGVAGENQTDYKYFESRPDIEGQEFVESTLEDATKEGEPYRPIFLSQNAITLANKVQVIIRFFGNPDEIHNNYDFQHTMCYWDHGAGDLVLPAEAMECLLSRTLVYRGSLYPIASIFRMKKFIERGWRITAGQQLKIMWQISEIDLSEPEVFYEQLTGVDMAYMHQLIDALKDVDRDKISSTYVAEIIDRIFD